MCRSPLWLDIQWYDTGLGLSVCQQLHMASTKAVHLSSGAGLVTINNDVLVYSCLCIFDLFGGKIGATRALLTSDFDVHERACFVYEAIKAADRGERSCGD